MITSKLQSASPSITITPPISFPFLWKSATTGRVYLRVASFRSAHPSYRGNNNQEVDVRLVNGLSECTNALPGELVYTGNEDHIAWGQRLPAGETVILTNAS